MNIDLALMGIYNSHESTEDQQSQAAEALSLRPQNQPENPLITAVSTSE